MKGYMKRMTLLFSMILTVTLGLTGTVTGSIPSKQKPLNSQKQLKNYVEGEVLVKFSNKTNFTTKLNVINKKGGTRLQELGNSGYMQVKLQSAQSVEDAVISYKSDPNIEYAQPNYIYHIMTTTPNDTQYGQLWGLKNTGQTISSPSYSTNNPGTSGKDMDLELAWDQITDCSSVVVAVIDSGVNYNNEDLSANMWDGSGSGYPNHGYDYVGSDNDPMDMNGHGTHVAGTIGAVGNNSKGTTGVCWSVKIMAVRVMDATGSGTTAHIVSGLNFAVTHGAKVVNMSLGGSYYDTAFSNAITSARTAGVVVVVAAGNDGVDVDSTSVYNPSYPCNYSQDNIICVTALDQAYTLADFSNFGSTSVDIGAPGTNIRSTWPGTTVETTTNFSDWTLDSTWAHQNIGYDVLSNPTNWNGTSTTYTANQSLTNAYKDFGAISQSANVVVLNLYINADIKTSDYLYLSYYDGTTLTTLYSLTDSSSYNYFIPISADITSLASGKATTEFDFWMSTNSTTNGYGVAIALFSVTTLVYNNTSYNTIDGTSMATPHVAGLAAMLFAFNPNYTSSDVVKAIKNGGEDVAALSGKTTSGKGANAWGSIKYIDKPTGVVATLQ